MIEINYIILERFSCDDNTISVGGMGYDKLKDCDQDTFICDALTHEFIHILLEDMFDRNTSSLFDFIGDNLLNTVILKQAIQLTDKEQLWSEVIKEDGIQHIYNKYMIDNIDLIQCYLICNTRSKT